jgi:hypothetical protein
MIKRLILLSLVVLLFAPFSSAQLWKTKRLEATGGVGTSQFYGDIGGYSIGDNLLGLRDFTFRQTRFVVNGSIRYFITDDFAARFSLSYIMLHADDTRGSNPERAYIVTSSLIEQAALAEYYFVRNRERNSFSFQTYRGVARRRLSDFFRSVDVYALAGLGPAFFKVRGNDKFETDLEAFLALPEQVQEDQVRKYHRGGTTFVIPVGVGAKVALDPNILVGVELIGRYGLPDFLDGYKNTEYSRVNDIYHTFSFTFNYRIRSARNWSPTYRR